jgi:hypothetical protein
VAAGDRSSWEELARRVGGSYEAGPAYAPHRIRAPVGAAILYLDLAVYLRGAGGLTMPDRRIRANMPYVSRDDFRIHIRPMGTVGRWLKLDDVKTGDAAFDEACQIVTSDPERAEALLGDATGYRSVPRGGERLRRHFIDNPWLEIRVDEPGAWLEDRRFVEGTLEARFETVDMTSSTAEAISVIVEAFRDFYEALVASGSAEDRDPRVIGRWLNP